MLEVSKGLVTNLIIHVYNDVVKGPAV